LVLYNVIRHEDIVRAMTTRQIRTDDIGSRPSEGKRVPMHLGLRVNRVSYQSENDRLRIGGYIIEAPEKYVLLGSHHTINLDLNREVTLTKNEWPKYDLERIKRSTEEKGRL